MVPLSQAETLADGTTGLPNQTSELASSMVCTQSNMPHGGPEWHPRESDGLQK